MARSTVDLSYLEYMRIVGVSQGLIVVTIHAYFLDREAIIVKIIL